jgi:2-dehydro-3-deoxygalactonokinase
VSDDGRADVMRGEETQVFGVLAQTGVEDAVICLPGTHSKWVKVENGAVVDFSTFMTGEMFELLTRHSSLSALCQEGELNHQDFLAGVEHAKSQGHLLNQLFTIRAWCMTGLMRERQSRSFLSGLLIGSEFVQAMSNYPSQSLLLVGAPTLRSHYALVAEVLGLKTQSFDAVEMTVAGLNAFLQQKQQKRAPC